MTHGFKDAEGNFHPTGNDSNKLSSHQVDKPKVVTMSHEEVQTAKKLMQQKADNDKPDSIGLKSHVHEKFGYPSEGKLSDEQRKDGNYLINKIVKMSKRQNPELENYVLHSPHVFNDYDTIQKSLIAYPDNITQLINWSNSDDPTKWKWLSPISLQEKSDDDDYGKLKSFDSQNLGWLTDAYKGKMALTIMSPKEYLKLASPRTLETGERNDIRGDEHTKETVDKLTQRMLDGKPVDTMYLEVNDDMKVYSHEGQHRALSAIKAGIEELPVYVYGAYFTEKQLRDISLRPMSILQHDTRNE